nr:MAG TPA: hypothetical protein [Caudoviricetes sp.]
MLYTRARFLFPVDIKQTPHDVTQNTHYQVDSHLAPC